MLSFWPPTWLSNHCSQVSPASSPHQCSGTLQTKPPAFECHQQVPPCSSPTGDSLTQEALSFPPPTAARHPYSAGWFLGSLLPLTLFFLEGESPRGCHWLCVRLYALPSPISAIHTLTHALPTRATQREPVWEQGACRAEGRREGASGRGGGWSGPGGREGRKQVPNTQMKARGVLTCPQVKGDPGLCEIWRVALGADSSDGPPVYVILRRSRH